MESEYENIEGLATALRVLAVLACVLGILAGVLMVVSRSGAIGGALVVIVATIAGALLLYAVAAALVLLVDIARTSQGTADSLELMRQRRRKGE